MIALLCIFVLCALLLFILQSRLERIAPRLLADTIPRHIRLDYEELNINVLTGSLGLKELTVDILDRHTLEPCGSVTIESLRMKGLSYWKYFINNYRIDSSASREIIPFTYENISLSLRQFYTELGAYETLTIDSLKLENKVLVVNQLALKTRYAKKELSARIGVERDHTTLEIPGLRLIDPQLEFRDSLFLIAADAAFLDRPYLEIYRDKLVADDPKPKKMYSRMLRELPFRLNIPKLDIHKGHVGYEELVDPEARAGRITFTNLNARLLNVSNTYKAPEKTEISASALFMDSAKVKLQWSFDVNNPEEFFIAKGSFSDFNAASANSFLESNMRLRVAGQVNSMYFTISGNRAQATGDMKMKYRNFDFVILKEDRSGINKLLTALGSIFVKQNRNTETPGYRDGRIEAERDATKSFFNYLWLNVRSGITNTLTGDGKKD